MLNELNPCFGAPTEELSSASKMPLLGSHPGKNLCLTEPPGRNNLPTVNSVAAGGGGCPGVESQPQVIWAAEKGPRGRPHVPPPREGLRASIPRVFQQLPGVPASSSAEHPSQGQEQTKLQVTQSTLCTPICTPTHTCGLLWRNPPAWTGADKETLSQM